MAHTSSSPGSGGPAALAASPGVALAPAPLARKWVVVHEAAGAIAALAGEAAITPDEAGFAEAVAQLAPGRRRLVDEGLADMIAVLEPGLIALLSIQKRGADASSGARALWREFVSARSAILSLIH